MKISLTVNKKSYNVEVEPNWSLAFVLREKLHLFGTKIGCNMGSCGVCTVIVDGDAVLSCLILAVDAKNAKSIETIEGLVKNNGVVLTKSVGDGPEALTFDGYNIWITNRYEKKVKVLDYQGNIKSNRTYNVDPWPSALAFDGKNVWVANGYSNSVQKLSTTSPAKVIQKWSVAPLHPEYMLFDDDGKLWLAGPSGGFCVMKLNISDGTIEANWAGLLGFFASAIEFDGKNIYVASSTDGKIIKLDKSCNQVGSPGLIPNGIDALAFDGINMWTANYYNHTVSKLNVSDLSIIDTFSLGDNVPVALTCDGEGNLWVANWHSSKFNVMKLRISDGRLLDTFPVGKGPRALVSDKNGSIWVANGLDDSVTKINADGGFLHDLQQAFLDSEAFQCGYCTPGFIMASKALLDKRTGKKLFPSKDAAGMKEVQEALSGHLCVCGGLKRVVETVAGKYYKPATKKTPSEYKDWIRNEPPCKIVPPTTGTAPPIPPLPSMDSIGKPANLDKQGDMIVRGKLDYGADHSPTGKKLYTRLLLSDKASAMVKGLKLKNSAKTLDDYDVKGIVTCSNILINNLVTASSSIKKDSYSGWSKEIKYWGQEVAAIATDDPNKSAVAVNELDIDYDSSKTLTPVIDPETAITEKGRVFHCISEKNWIYKLPSNNALHILLGKILGPITRGTPLNKSPYEQIGWTQLLQHGSLESCSCVAWWYKDSKNNDRYDIWSCSQDPDTCRQVIAGKGTAGGLLNVGLGVQIPQVRFFTYGTGNAHGDKTFAEWCIPAAILSELTKQPVELSLSRRENFLTRTHQFRAKAKISIDADSKGYLTSIDAQYWGSGGRNKLLEPILEWWTAFVKPLSFAKGIPLRGLSWPLQSTYKCSNAKFQIDTVLTDTPRSGYWRCVADSPGTFLEDIAMEKKAYALNMQPYEFKKKNLVSWNAKHQDSKKWLSSNGIKECYEACAEAIGLDTAKPNYIWHLAKKKKVSDIYPSSVDDRWHGVGIAGHVDMHGSLGLPFETLPNAEVKITRSGKAVLYVGISRAACGTNTAICHIVAEELGFIYEDVVVADWGNLDKALVGGIQGGSSRTITLGAAYSNAAEKANEQLRKKATKFFGLTQQDYQKLKIENSEIKATINNKLVIIKVKDIMAQLNYDIIGKGKCWARKLQRKHGTTSTKSNKGEVCEVLGTSCSAAEVAVDPKTGQVEILNFVNAIDNGRTIFHYGARKEIEGGIEIQIGQGLFYEQILDSKSGATLNTSYLDNKWPTTLDLNLSMTSEKLKPIIVETNDACGPFGCKGMGEPCVSNFVCITNAIYNAIGEWITEPPITPKKILDALYKGP